MLSCEIWHVPVSAECYRAALILLIVFVLGIVLCLCVRLLSIVTLVRHIIHWVQTQKLLGDCPHNRNTLYFAFSSPKGVYQSSKCACVRLAHNRTATTQLISVIESRYNDRKRENVNKKM